MVYLFDCVQGLPTDTQPREMSKTLRDLENRRLSQTCITESFEAKDRSQVLRNFLDGQITHSTQAFLHQTGKHLPVHEND